MKEIKRLRNKERAGRKGRKFKKRRKEKRKREMRGVEKGKKGPQKKKTILRWVELYFILLSTDIMLCFSFFDTFLSTCPGRKWCLHRFFIPLPVMFNMLLLKLKKKSEIQAMP